VYKEVSTRDKGAAKVLREKLDELKRAHGQDVLAAEWAERANAMLTSSRLNIADAMAWQRDAAKAGAPLSREPLASLKLQLNEKIKAVEDLQHQVMVQRETAVLLAQRIEVLSTKSLKEAIAANELLQSDVAQWHQQAHAITEDASWHSVDLKFPPQLDASRHQLSSVWEAFEAALFQAKVARDDANETLPPVPVWAEEIRIARGGQGVQVGHAKRAHKIWVWVLEFTFQYHTQIFCHTHNGCAFVIACDFDQVNAAKIVCVFYQVFKIISHVYSYVV
jgi:hypothetical protein